MYYWSLYCQFVFKFRWSLRYVSFRYLTYVHMIKFLIIQMIQCMNIGNKWDEFWIIYCYIMHGLHYQKFT